MEKKPVVTQRGTRERFLRLNEIIRQGELAFYEGVIPKIDLACVEVQRTLDFELLLDPLVP